MGFRELDMVRTKRAVQVYWGDEFRVLPRHSLGTVIGLPTGGWACVEFDPDEDGGGWITDVPTRYLEAA